jgi:uncharacterized protein YneF (UPF0154 family)
MWRVTLRMRDSESKVSEVGTTLDYAKILKAGDHGVFFYRGPYEKREVLFNFLQAGFQKGEGAIYVASQENSEQIRRHMEDFGFNVKALERDCVLRIFDYDSWYIIDGEVNVPHIMMMSQRVFDEAMEIGLKGLRGCGEIACFFEHKKQRELVEYELGIGRNFVFPVTVLCAYDANHAKFLDEKLFVSLIKAHGPVVTSSFAREITFENLFPPITDNVLETMFGEMGKKIILKILAERYSLTPNKIAEDPVAFIEGLEKLLGSGSCVVARSLVRKMHLKMGIRR